MYINAVCAGTMRTAARNLRRLSKNWYNIWMPVYKTKNEDFFKTWSPDMAYILGFFCADGAMTVNPRGSKYIDFVITDLSLLKDIRTAFSSNHKIKARFDGYLNVKTRYRLQIGSKKIFQDLLGLGLTPKKTFRMKLPLIPPKFFNDFVRGYFDGDGNVWFGTTHKDRKTPNLALRTSFTSGNQKFLESLSNELNKQLGIGGSLIFRQKAYRLTYSTSGSLFLYKFMYNNAGLLLSRKKVVFERYLDQKSNNAVVA